MTFLIEKSKKRLFREPNISGKASTFVQSCSRRGRRANWPSFLSRRPGSFSSETVGPIRIIFGISGGGGITQTPPPTFK